MRTIYLAVVAGLAIATAVFAVEPDEMLADPALEARARVISKDLRCVVCQNQDIDSSNAGVARDLRLLVRERLVAGDTNAEVLQFVTARYGDYVLLKPPFKPRTYALWLAPGVLFLGGLSVVLAILLKARRRTATNVISDEDERLVAEILSQNGKGN